MEPRIKWNQYTVGSHGHYYDVDSGDLVEGSIIHIINWQLSHVAGYSIYLVLAVDRGRRTIRVA